MRKVVAWVMFLFLFFVVAGVTQAVMPNPTQSSNTKSHNQTPLTIPSTAVQVAPDVFSLGSAVDPVTGQVVDGFMIVHRRQDSAKNISAASKSGGSTTCYGFLASGAKWKTVEPWVVNATNSAGIADTTILSTMQNNTYKWEDATNGVLNDNISGNIFGDGSLTSATLTADSTAPDGVNEVYFGSIADNNTIAVTTVWGVFRGPTASRSLVEWDMVFNTYYSWSVNNDPNAMDFENISTHEMGHAVGLADLYTSACSEQTMYGYASQGETKKRDLNTGDLQGVNLLY